MAHDVNAFIEALHLQQPVVLGFSDGGIIAIELALLHPEKVKAIATCGVDEAWVRSKLRQAGVMRPQDVFFAQLTPDGMLRVQTRQSLGARQSVVRTEVTGRAV